MTPQQTSSYGDHILVRFTSDFNYSGSLDISLWDPYNNLHSNKSSVGIDIVWALKGRVLYYVCLCACNVCILRHICICIEASNTTSTKAVQTEDRTSSLDFPSPPPALTNKLPPDDQTDDYLSLKACVIYFSRDLINYMAFCISFSKSYLFIKHDEALAKELRLACLWCHYCN